MERPPVAWFCNHYTCARCNYSWTDEWSCTCDDDCPHCGARHMSPTDSEDLTEVIERVDGKFVVMRSPETAEHGPDYRWVEGFPTLAEAQTFLGIDPAAL